MKTASKQKLRLLYIAEILSQKSDEDHPLTANDIMTYLEELYGIRCDRKTVYDCIECLNEFGCEIIYSSSPRGYFAAPYYFELPELRLLIDAVQAANFISVKKTKTLLEKLGKFVSEHQFSRLKKQIYIDNRNKSDNESVLYHIDILNSAIENRRQVNVVYHRRKIVDGKRALYEKKQMTINPYALIWSNDHYYLVGNYNKYDNLIHLRVDRLKSVELTDTPARRFSEVSTYTNAFDAADYSNKHLSMFSGDIKPVELICKNDIIEEFIDKFGEKCTVIPFDDCHFTARVGVAVNDGLVSWIMQFGNKIKVVHPNELKNMIIDKTGSILELYNQ